MKYVICDKCDHGWNTKSQLLYVSCPCCLGKVNVNNNEQ